MVAVPCPVPYLLLVIVVTRKADILNEYTLLRPSSPKLRPIFPQSASPITVTAPAEPSSHVLQLVAISPSVGLCSPKANPPTSGRVVVVDELELVLVVLLEVEVVELEVLLLVDVVDVLLDVELLVDVVEVEEDVEVLDEVLVVDELVDVELEVVVLLEVDVVLVLLDVVVELDVLVVEDEVEDEVVVDELVLVVDVVLELVDEEVLEDVEVVDDDVLEEVEVVVVLYSILGGVKLAVHRAIPFEKRNSSIQPLR